MSRQSNDQYEDGRLINGFDYINQAWVLGGQYQACGHSENMGCDCYGKEHEGEETPEVTATECDVEEGIDIDWPPIGPRF